MKKEELEAFRYTILDHYHREGRDFPWRRTSDPYAILVSEIMLQQTQTDRVLPKYLNWLERFPNASSLARADLVEVLSAWSGLGYNRRARFLQEAARIICFQYAGVFPQTAKALDALPGIGPYTAGAVATFAFGRPEVFIETNIRSVFLFFFFPDRISVPDKEILPLVELSLDRTDPRSWYYALMDYGASLKRRVKNPGRRSAHYVRQSAFSGSLREARGAIIRFLSSEPARSEAPQGMRLEEIEAASGIYDGRIYEAAQSLMQEGMLVFDSGVYRIGE